VLSRPVTFFGAQAEDVREMNFEDIIDKHSVCSRERQRS
jgi:hypothetical protein